MFTEGAGYAVYNWVGLLTKEQAGKNIFCYGKPHSGKTGAIGIFTALCAMREGRSCVIYAENASHNYAMLKIIAKDNNIPVLEMDVSDFDTNQDSCERGAREIEKYIAPWKAAYDEGRHNAPFLMLLSDANIKTAPALKLESDLLPRSIFPDSEFEERSFRKWTASRKKSMLIVLDDMDAPMYIAPCYTNSKMFQFCVIMATGDIASQPWRLRATKSIAHDYYENAPQFIDTKEGESWLRKVEQDQFASFFYNIEIVICTGNTVKPEYHRDFVRRIIHNGKLKNSIKPAHRYLCEETPMAAYTAQMILSKENFEQLSIENIDTSDYWQIANENICSGDWLLLVNDKIAVYSTTPTKKKKCVLKPCVFLHERQAQNSLELEWSSDPNLRITDEETSPTIIIYKGTRTENGLTVPIEYTLIKLAPEDVDTYRMRFLYRILQILEQTNDEPISEEIDSTEENNTPASVTEASPSLPEIPAIEPYWEQYQRGGKTDSNVVAAEELTKLPDRALFLGGHRNMVKRLEPLHPGWDFITDDEIKGGWRNMTYKYIFFWTKHCSHMLQDHILSKLAPGAEIIYVTATNVERLEDEMLTGYRSSLVRKKRGE